MVFTSLAECRKEIDETYKEMSDQRLANSNNWRRIEDLDERLRVYRRFQAASQKMLSLCEGLDTTFREELRARGLTRTRAQSLTDIVFARETKTTIVDIAKCNVDSATLGLQQFSLLKSNFGNWRIEQGMPVFASRELNEQWGDTVQSWLQLRETKESLAREWATSK